MPRVLHLVGPRTSGLCPIEEGLFGEAHPLREEHAFGKDDVVGKPDEVGDELEGAGRLHVAEVERFPYLGEECLIPLIHIL